MTRLRLFFGWNLLVGALLIACWAAATGRPPAGPSLAGPLGLTDLALWTEARYTRHPSQADQFAAFQDLPGAIEHFPAGSLLLLAPPVPATH